MNGSNLPRADVSTGALGGAIAALLTALIVALNGGGALDMAIVWASALIIVQFAIEYLVPSRKLASGAIAGAIVTVAAGIYDLAAGGGLDAPTFTTAVAYLITTGLTALLPPRQP
jgi:uncharacterized membrane protein (UPF0136 family)